jgi:hypothetical protein
MMIADIGDRALIIWRLAAICNVGGALGFTDQPNRPFYAQVLVRRDESTAQVEIFVAL